MNGGFGEGLHLSLYNNVLPSSRKAQIFPEAFILISNMPINYNRRTEKMSSVMKDSGIINTFLAVYGPGHYTKSYKT